MLKLSIQPPAPAKAVADEIFSLRAASSVDIRGKELLFDIPKGMLGDFERLYFEDVSLCVIRNGIVTPTGAIITSKGAPVLETLEGGLEDNRIRSTESGSIKIESEIVLHNNPIIASSRFGVFNYSVFLHEVLPTLYISQQIPHIKKYEYTLYFPKFLNAKRREHVMEFCSLFLPRDSSFMLDDNYHLFPEIYVVSLGYAKNMRRIKRIMPEMFLDLNLQLRGYRDQSLPEKIYICREKGAIREAANREEVLGYFARHGFTIVELEGKTPAEQAALFRQARVIVAEHGAALANLWFSRPGCRVLEIFPDKLIGRWLYRLVSQLQGLEYCAVSTPTPDGWIWNRDKVHVDLSAVSRGLDSILAEGVA
jgi:hypothetical protein